MANQEQLAILNQGVKVWNEWREKNPEIEIDLSEAYLIGSDLHKANLAYANLSLAELSGANFRRANLRMTDLRGADLHEAILCGADLSGRVWYWDVNDPPPSPIIVGADSRETRYRRKSFAKARRRKVESIRAIFTGTDLTGTDLRKADLTGACIGYTSFCKVDLSLVKGLAKINHFGPSIIDVDTVYKSKGKIPEIFLRGCGVPENMITFMHSLTAQEKALDFYSCFISYSSKNQNFAERLHADLQSKGVRVWFAQEDLKIGDKFRTRIDEAIKVYDKLLIVLSENSINSSWVEKEVEAAFEKENREKRVVLFPIRLDDSVMETAQAWAADIRRTRHIGDFTSWKEHDKYQKAFERLMRDLKASESSSKA